MNYKYRCKDSLGADKAGWIEALDELDAAHKLQEQGLIVISIEKAKEEQPVVTKKCPYCAEEIKSDAIKCRFCGSMLDESARKVEWHLKTSTLITAFVCVGPLALPLLWINPRFSRKTKIIVTAIAVILTVYAGYLVINSLKSLKDYYGIIFQGI